MLKISYFFKSKYHNSRWFYVVLFLLIFVLINVRQTIVTNFNCEICSDKAGYFMYLPAVFQYGFKADNYPEKLDEQHGNGFRIDKVNNKIITKFTCGVALLQLPFYSLGILIAKVFSLNVLPYTYYYLFFINIGAAFYIVLGLFFLRKWLNYYVDDMSSFWCMLVIFFGTNLYYYTLDESLMSHLYSFLLFSAILYGLKTFCETKKINFFLLFTISLSLAVLIRPTNILFLIIALFVDVNTFNIFKKKLLLLLSPKYFIPAIFIFLLIITPQLLYWKFAYGKYLVWSYEGESFRFWKNPWFLTVWFSPQSGLFTYTPIIILSLIFSVIMLIKKEMNAVLVIMSFLIVSYMCASWCNPYFGTCNFGKRPMVEYLPIIMFPIAHMLNKYKSYNKRIRYILLISIIVLVYYNQVLFGAFNTCFFGDTWGWNEFGLLLKRAFLFKG